jgi:serine/threonine protein kinase
MTDDKRDDTRSTESDFAALWSSDGVTRSMSPTATGMPADLPFLFGPGQTFGGYLIIRPLGKGGMGQVYEAEETESGRRVALKLLSRGLGDDEERERFLREGRLAASLSHPNCVYVFGTSEIQGFPVIAMELVPEGTLKDRVVPRNADDVGAGSGRHSPGHRRTRSRRLHRHPAPRHQALELLRPSGGARAGRRLWPFRRRQR